MVEGLFSEGKKRGLRMRFLALAVSPYKKRGKKMEDQEKEREAELLARAKSGDGEAFDELVIRHSQRLFRVAYMFLGSKQDAEEVVQDAFMRAYKSLDSFRGDSSFETWMHRITLNLSRNRFHWNRRRGEGRNISLSVPFNPAEQQFAPGAFAADWDLPDERMTPDQELENDELEANIASIIDTLPEKFRESLVLRHQFEMSYEAIARTMNVPVNTVKTRIKRARELLREGLASLEQHRAGR